MFSVSGSMKAEMKASGTEGNAPEFGLLIESSLGAERSAVTKTSSDADGSSYTDTQIALADADASEYAVGDIVTTKRAGAYHTSPIISVNNTPGAVSITLLIADPAGAYVDGIVISAVQTYLPADVDHPSFSVAKYIEDAVLEQAAGCKTTSMSLENFTTGQLAAFNFNFEGLNTDRSVSALGLTPSYDDVLPPIILEACVYQDGVLLPVNEAAFTVENEVGFISSTCAENGKIASRMTKRNITGSLNPYKQNDSVAQWDKFEANTEFSVFLYAKVPTGVDGEYEDVVGVYMPNCITAALSETDADGVLQDGIEFIAARGSDASSDEIFISFI